MLKTQVVGGHHIRHERGTSGVPGGLPDLRTRPPNSIARVSDAFYLPLGGDTFRSTEITEGP